MNLAFCAFALLTAAAQQTAPAAPAPAPAAPANATAPAAPTAFDLDTPIEVLMADPRAKAVLDARMPRLATNPAYEMIKGYSLRQVQPFSQGQITDELLATVQADLALIH